MLYCFYRGILNDSARYVYKGDKDTTKQYEQRVDLYKGVILKSGIPMTKVSLA